VFGGRTRKRVKSEPDLDWLSDDNRAGLPMERASAPQPSSAPHRGYPERVRMAALDFRLAETLGGTAKPGWSPRKGRRLSPFLGARSVAIRPIRRFFFQSTLNCLEANGLKSVRRFHSARRDRGRSSDPRNAQAFLTGIPILRPHTPIHREPQQAREMRSRHQHQSTKFGTHRRTGNFPMRTEP
jgi:hypothetical protein